MFEALNVNPACSACINQAKKIQQCELDLMRILGSRYNDFKLDDSNFFDVVVDIVTKLQQDNASLLSKLG